MLGVSIIDGATRFSIRAPDASAVWLCLFGKIGNARERRFAMVRAGDPGSEAGAGDWEIELPGNLAGTRYGYRAEGEWRPGHGLWFDEAKLLVDPHAVELDRRFVQDPRLAQFGEDTADIVPRAVVPPLLPDVIRHKPRFAPGGLVYELNVRGFTMLHPDVPQNQRGTVSALAYPSVIAHLKKLHVSAVELMPIVAWIDERHLPPLDLVNAWGYNPVALMALDPGLCPGGVTELRETVAALHAAGIGVILDIVLNHTGESDVAGGVLSLRGLDNACYAHDCNEGLGGRLINDTGCGNTLSFAYEPMRRLALDTLRHFVKHCGIDGFRFDLAPILARGPGFDAAAPIFAEIATDPWLADRVMIAEPWDIGPGGYQLGHFPANWLEWNDRYRDDVRRFWRGDEAIGVLATRLAGSADVFGERASRSVNFLAAHDGFTLADSVAYEERHNEANGEQNRDGHGENFSWNHGVEGPSDDADVVAARSADLRALLATLFASTGTVLLTAGDEFGRSQQGNNNAYAQDNAIGWVDWAGRDRALEDFTAGLAAWRAERADWFAQFPTVGEWLRADGEAMTAEDWDGTAFVRYRSLDPAKPYEVIVDRAARKVTLDDWS